MSIAEPIAADAIAAARQAEKRGADLIEMRLDYFEGLTKRSIERLFNDLAGIGIPKLATIMPSTLFGRFNCEDSIRAELLLEAANHADYVDIGVEMNQSILRDCLDQLIDKVEVILSWHSDRPLTIKEISSITIEYPGHIIYKVCMPAVIVQDNLIALEACSSLHDHKRIIFCYGRNGMISRVLSPLFGSEWAFASLRKGKETAPGQLDIESMRMIQEMFG